MNFEKIPFFTDVVKMGRKRKVPPGIVLRNWRDSFDESSSSDDQKCSRLPSRVPRTTESILREDLSPTPSTAPSTSDTSDDQNRSRLPSSIPESVLREDLPTPSSAAAPSVSSINTEDDDVYAMVQESEEVESNAEDVHTMVQESEVESNADVIVEQHLPERRRNAAEYFLREDLSPSVADIEGRDTDEESDPSRDSDDEEDFQNDIVNEDDTDADNDDDATASECSFDSWIGNEMDEEPENEYEKLLNSLSEKWLLVELNHSASKAASNAFWGLAIDIIPTLFETRRNLQITRKIPQFVTVRRTLHKKLLPKIHHTVGYEDEISKEIVEIEDGDTSVIRNSQIKIFESASVKVITTD